MDESLRQILKRLYFIGCREEGAKGCISAGYKKEDWCAYCYAKEMGLFEGFKV